MDDSKIMMFPDSAKSSIDPGLLALLNQNGGFSGNGSWIWIMFLWLIAAGGNGFGGGFGNNNGTGFLANQISNTEGRDLLLLAINGRADALSQLASITNTSVETVRSGIFTLQSSIQTVGAQVGMSGLQVQNAVLAGNAALSQLICECCCENRLAIANQTSALQTQAASNFAATQLLLAQNEAADLLSVCQLTNQLGALADRNTNTVLNAIAAQNTMITKEFCDIRERELLDKINTQGDIITLLRGQLDNDRLTAQLFAAINPLQAKVNEIANKQPNTVPVEWPNLTAVNNTPYAGGFYGYGGFNGFGWGGSFWG